MVRKSDPRGGADRIGMFVGSDHVSAVSCRSTGPDLLIVGRWAVELGPGAVRDGMVVDHRGVVAALRQMALPPLPAVVALGGGVVPAGASALVVHAWSGSRVVQCSVPIDVVCRHRDAAAAAGLRARGWVPAPLALLGDPRSRISDPNGLVTDNDLAAVGAALWEEPQTWPVALPSAPLDTWAVDQVG